MQKRFKGDKNIFAIEYEITELQPKVIAKFCIWVGGIKLGNFEDPIMLLPMKNLILKIKEKFNKFENMNLSNINPEVFYYSLFEKDEYGSESIKDPFYKYFCQFLESFDDFTIFWFKDGENIHFFWELRDNPTFQYPHHPKGIQHKVVNFKYYCNVVNDEELWKIE